MTQRTAPLGKLALERGFELLRTFGLVRWGLGGSGHVEGTGEKLSFASQAARYPNLPSKIKAGYLNCKLRPYIPNPLRCFKCQRFGHSQNSCRGQLTCSRCAAVGHSSTDCTLEPKCINCSQIHTADSKLCPKWKTEKEIQTIKTNRNISYFEARKLIAPQFSQTYAQVAKPSIATSTTQTDENITKVKCPPLQILKPLLSVPHPNASPSITSNSTSSSTTQDTSDEDMLIYDVAEEVESPQKLTPVNEIEKFSDEWWQAEGWKREEYSRTLTPTRNRKSRIKKSGESLKKKKDAEIIPTKHLILTFNNPKLPTTIKAGYLNCKIRPYIPNPLRCFQCQRFGHSHTACRGQLTCSRCATVGHPSTDCTLEPKCVNCSQSHPSDSKLCSQWKTEKEIQIIKTNRNLTYLEARKLIAPQLSQSYAQVTKLSTTTTTTQTDENITKFVCPPLKLLQPLVSVPKPTISSSVAAVTKPSSSTQTQLLPSASFVTVPSLSESQPSIPLIDTAPTTSNNLSVLEPTTTISNTIPATSQDANQTSKPRRKKRPPKNQSNTVKPKIEIKTAPHRPRKSGPTEYTTDEEDMIIYDVEDEPEPNPQYVLNMNGFTYKGEMESWSQQLDNKLHSVKPVIEAWPVMPMRRTDVKLTRLRIGHTRFTHRHLLFGERAPECPSCHVSYTVLSNTSWKADRPSLLRVYQAIVLSRIDYGCVAYGSACNSTLQKLDPVHHMALRICSGAFSHITGAESLCLVISFPLDLRRRKLSLAYYFKILSVPSHPLQNVYMSTSMKRLYDARPSNIRPFMDRMKLHISELDLPNVHIQQRNLFNIPTLEYATVPLYQPLCHLQ
ncbi:uncharacterized protein TNCV_198981 [Trichonephila clavipes]|nr:uncharacterized protein TNCV_198981 [Trichonephila clavipes]